MFNFISFNNATVKFQKLIGRFPVPLVVTIVGTIAAWSLVQNGSVNSATNSKLLLVCFLALPWSILGALVAEKYRYNLSIGLLFQLVFGLLALSYYFLLPSDINRFAEVEVARSIILTIIGLILMVVFSFDQKDSNKLWNFCLDIFLSTVTTILFALGLGIGLTLAIAAIWYLLQIKSIPQGEVILRTWCLVWGIFATWFFMANLLSVDNLPDRQELPKTLRIFLHYICLPVVAVFFIVLYIYFIKIVAIWDWPKGGVSNWIIGFSSVGFLVYLFCHKDAVENKKLKLYFSTFFALVLPLTVVLFLAVGFRIKQYGFTEQRYLIVAAGIWLLIAALYYLINKNKKIQLIPYLVVLFLLLASVLPYGNMYSVSMNNQVGRLEKILSDNKLLVQGKIQKNSQKQSVSQKDFDSINSILDYVVSHGGLSRIEAWFDQGLGQPSDKDNLYSVTGHIFYLLNIYSGQDIYDSIVNNESVVVKNFSFLSQAGSFTNIGDYDLIFYGLNIIGTQFEGGKNNQFDVPGVGRFNFKINSSSDKLQIIKDSNILGEVELLRLVNKLVDQYGVNGYSTYPADMVLNYEKDGLRIKLLVDGINGKYTKGDLGVDGLRATVLVRLKK